MANAATAASHLAFEGIEILQAFPRVRLSRDPLSRRERRLCYLELVVPALYACAFALVRNGPWPPLQRRP